MFRRRRSLESLRGDFLFTLMRTKGLYFMNETTLMNDKAKDKRVLSVLCPKYDESAVRNAFDHLKQLLAECCASFHLHRDPDPAKYWRTVVAAMSDKHSIEMPWDLGRELVFRILRGHQRWQIRQDGLPPQDLCVFISHVQVLLGKFEQDMPRTGHSVSRSRRAWRLTDEERAEVKQQSVAIGPAKRISKKKFQLSKNGPQKLRLITEFGGRWCKPNTVGLVGKMLEASPEVAGTAPPRDKKQDSTNPDGPFPKMSDVSSGGLISPSLKSQCKAETSDKSWPRSLPFSDRQEQKSRGPLERQVKQDSPCISPRTPEPASDRYVGRDDKKRAFENGVAEGVSPSPNPRKRAKIWKPSVFINHRK